MGSVGGDAVCSSGRKGLKVGGRSVVIDLVKVKCCEYFGNG